MANLPYELIAASTPFTILVGPEQKKFTMHKELLASMSHKLDILVNGKMDEARKESVDWGDLDERTFVCFFEYAYTGNYNISHPQGNDRSQNDVSQSQSDNQSQHQDVSEYMEEQPRAPEGWDVGPVERYRGPVGEDLTMKCPRCKRVVPMPAPPRKAKDLLWWRFINLEYPGPPSEGNTDPTNGSVSFDLNGMILSHARVYVLADYHRIDKLKLLSLKKLHQCLVDFETTSAGAETIASLAAYCHENTPDKHPKDELRELLCLYLACKIEQMWDNASFREALEVSRDLARDVIEQMLNRLD
ncbi:hypothetical protein GGR57DRAFT_35714 [Xylariaceae sp. FL1272]|nr:hypothetical protein GGR57DRAFT_35714 [Xylariaceae sp. FL1272]